MRPHRQAAALLLLSAAWRMTPESVVLHSGAIVFNGAFVTLMPATVPVTVAVVFTVWAAGVALSVMVTVGVVE